MKSDLRGDVRRQASPMVRPGCGDAKRKQLHPIVANLDVDGDLRNQRHAIAIGHHLHDGRERGGAETHRTAAPAVGAERQRLIAQAVPFLEQDEPILIDVAGRDACGLRPGIAGRHRQQERVVEQRHGFEIRVRDRQRQHDDVEVPRASSSTSTSGLGLAQFDLQLRISLLQFRQHASAGHTEPGSE